MHTCTVCPALTGPEKARASRDVMLQLLESLHPGTRPGVVARLPATEDCAQRRLLTVVWGSPSCEVKGFAGGPCCAGRHAIAVGSAPCAWRSPALCTNRDQVSCARIMAGLNTALTDNTASKDPGYRLTNTKCMAHGRFGPRLAPPRLHLQDTGPARL